MRRTTLFWGMYLIIGGITLLLKNILFLHFSSFWVLGAELVILLGIFLLTGGFRRDGRQVHSNGQEYTTSFSQSNVTGDSQTAVYNVTFSSTTIVLPENPPPIVRVNACFGDVTVVLPPNRAVRVRLNSSFATADAPGFSVNGFGQKEALLGSGEASFMEGKVVFGSLQVKMAP